MKKWLINTANFFAFTKSERRGIVALLGIFAFLMIGIQIIPYCYSKPCDLGYADNLSESSASNRARNYRGHSYGKPHNSLHVEIHSRASLRQHNGNDSLKTKNFKPIREQKPFTVQANICDTLDLQQIRGIGSAFSKRIIKYRDQLGGFVRKEQLLEIWGIDSAKYAQIQPAFIIDKKNVRKLNINTTTIKELQNHPYLDYYQAKAIVKARDNQGFYENIDDILKIALIDRETFELIREYLEL